MRYRVTEFLDDEGIEWHDSGPNISEGWVAINCPFYLCSDPSFHLGINPDFKDGSFFSCWVCGKKGSFEYLVQVLKNMSKYSAEKLLSSYIDSSYENASRELPDDSTEEIRFPSDVSKEFAPDVLEYLRSRDFDPDILITKYDLLWADKFSFLIYHGKEMNYKYRIIVPIKYNGRTVSWTGRAISDIQHPRYKNAPYDMKAYLYNIDTVRDTLVIVEGPSDVWRMGDGFVGIMGIQFTNKQIEQIARKKPLRAFTMLDPEPIAQKRAEKLAAQLSGIVPYVENIYVDEAEDPGKLTNEQAKYYRKELGL